VVEPAVIDLGADFDTVEWVRPPPPVWWRRGWALAGYAALALLFLGPPTAARAAPLVPIVTLPAGGAITYGVSADTLFAAWFAFQAPDAGSARPQPSRATLDAYRLKDGQLRWRVIIPVDVRDLMIRPAGPDTVVVSSLELSAAGDRTIAYDVPSGRLLWASELPLLPTGPVGDTALLGAYISPDGTPLGSPYAQAAGTGAPPAMVLRAVQVRTGATAWALRVPAGSRTALPVMAALSGEDNPYAVMIDPSSEARSINLHTGALSPPAQVRIGSTRTVRGDEQGPALAVSGRWLIIAYQGAGGPTLASYRADTLAPGWTGRVDSLNVVATACAALTCLTDEEGSRAVDLATGRVAWMATASQPVGMLGRWLYAVPLDAARNGYPSLLVPASGTTALRLTGWAAVPGPAGGPYLVNAEKEPGLPGGAWLGVVHTVAGVPRVEPVAPLAGLVIAGCTAVPDFVVCLTRDQYLWVWRYRV
jgi:hypothetical protein